ncbi:cytochrome P450 [Amycolatopsis taiwanensis]|nr:cytochrome P450 [Amycolatopsis taiwanensis]
MDGVMVRTGDLVVLDNRAANHDPAVFPDPDRVDVARSGAAPLTFGHRAQLTFGHGARYCLGAPLARIELQAVLAQLVTRFPAMRLAVPVETLRLRHNALTGGLTELPVSW